MTTSVLIIDDDDAIRDMYATAFELAGHEVFKAENAEDGVALALTKQPSIILMDITMPGASGHEAVEKIRADAWGKTAKIMYLTNLSDAGNLMEAVEQKSDEYIVKSNTDPKDIVKKAEALMFSVRSDVL